jgi:uncharacterized protein YhhL (DUF1145 family)
MQLMLEVWHLILTNIVTPARRSVGMLEDIIYEFHIMDMKSNVIKVQTTREVQQGLCLSTKRQLEI